MENNYLHTILFISICVCLSVNNKALIRFHHLLFALGIFLFRFVGMMRSQFVEQVQLLMEIQQIKHTELLFGKSNYMWLCSKKVSMVWMSTKDECRIRQALTKVSPDQQVQIMKQLLTWLDDNPRADVLKIPEVTLRLINNTVTNNLINEVNFSRMSSFRNSIRRLSILSNKISPAPPRLNAAKARRSVTFNDVPVIYRISK